MNDATDQTSSALRGAFFLGKSMLRKLLIGLASLAVLSGSVQAAGTVPGFSLTPQFDLLGKVAPGCKLYVIQAGTTSTPQNSYQDTALTIAQPNPMTCDSTGRLPQWFVADGQIKLRLTDKNGVQIFVGDNLLVIGPSSGGGGGGGSVDPTTILATGDFKDVYNTGNLTGFVRCNARTIGSATSGATERANADTSALFVFFWNADVNLPVSGGRGASGAADFAANKALTLPDCRGRVRSAMSDMGNADSGRISTTYFGCTGLVLGCAGGSESQTLTTAQLAAHTHANSLNDPGHFHQVAVGSSGGGTAQVTQGVNSPGANVGTGAGPILTNTTGMSITNASAGSGTPHANVQPTILVTTYIKL